MTTITSNRMRIVSRWYNKSILALSLLKRAAFTFLLLHLAALVDLSASEQIIPLQRQARIFYDGTTLRVPVQIFGKTLYFIVDSGSTISEVDVRYIHFLGKPMEDLQASAMNTAGSRLSIYHCPDCTIANAPIGIPSIAALDLSAATKISGSQCDGILGMDFLRQHVVSIDFDNDIMTISEQTPDGTKHKGLAIPLRSIRGQHVAVDATVNQVKMQLMIDTGDTGSMTLSTADWQRVFPSGSAKVHTIIEGGPWGKPMSVSAARIEKVEIASNHYRDLVATLAKNPAAPSTLGLKFLRRHIVTFDFANQTLFLEPSSLFTEIESADMSGLHIIRLGDDTVIYAVDEESPAAQAKLAAGDIIESINGKESGTLTLWEIRRALKIRDGEPVTVKIKRGDEEGLYHFVLRSSL